MTPRHHSGPIHVTIEIKITAETDQTHVLYRLTSGLRFPQPFPPKELELCDDVNVEIIKRWKQHTMTTVGEWTESLPIIGRDDQDVEEVE